MRFLQELEPILMQLQTHPYLSDVLALMIPQPVLTYGLTLVANTMLATFFILSGNVIA